MDRDKLKSYLKIIGLVATIGSIAGFIWAFMKISSDTEGVCPPGGPMYQACMDKYFSPQGPGHFVGQAMTPLTIAFTVGSICLITWFVLWVIDRRQNSAGAPQVGSFQMTGTQSGSSAIPIPVPVAEEQESDGQSDSSFCPECGFKNDSDQNFCNSCGSALS